jgi:hypothetical protein
MLSEFGLIVVIITCPSGLPAYIFGIILFYWASALPYLISHGKKHYPFSLLRQWFFIEKALIVWSPSPPG